MKQTEIEGWGSLKRLGGVLDSLGAESILLVTGRHSYHESGAQGVLDQILSPYAVTRFCDFGGDRDLSDLEKGAELLRSGGFGAVISVGGGTVIDTAKLISILAAHEGEVGKYITGEALFDKKGLPLVAVPTTSGSGSESTHFAVVFMHKLKYSVAHEHMLPDYSILDPSLTVSMTPGVTAVSGLDALAQAIESHWSINSTDQSRGYSGRALRLAVGHLKNAVRSPDRRSREAMAEAAHLAGKAINIAKTTAAHAVSYYFTIDHNVPHGHAVALTLGSFIEFNNMVSAADVAEARGLDHVRHSIEDLLDILGAGSGSEAAGVLESLMHEIGLETDIRKMGVNGKYEVDRLVESVNVERLRNNPRRVEPHQIPAIIGVEDLMS